MAEELQPEQGSVKERPGRPAGNAAALTAMAAAVEGAAVVALVDGHHPRAAGTLDLRKMVVRPSQATRCPRRRRAGATAARAEQLVDHTRPAAFAIGSSIGSSTSRTFAVPLHVRVRTPAFR